MHAKESLTMKKKIVLACFIATIILVSIVVVIIGNKFFDLKKAGNLWDDWDVFALDVDTEEPNELTKAYLQSIHYEIIEIDDANKIASIKLEVPRMTSLLSDVLTNTIDANSELEYDLLKEKVIEELVAVMKSNETEKDVFELELPLEKVGRETKIVPNDEWNNILLGNLEKMYLEYFKTIIGGMTNENFE